MKKLLVLCAALVAGSTLWADWAEDRAVLLRVTEPRTFSCADGSRFRYRWHEPTQVVAGKTYPLVILMHGAGERGTNNVAQLRWGAKEIFAWFAAHRQEFYFVAGQVPENQQWVDVPWAAPAHRMPKDPSAVMAQQIEFLEHGVFGRFPVDRQRVYVTGVSMGGYGTWDILCRRTSWFAAAMPVCGGADIQQAWRVRDVPIWIHHGDRDTVVPFARSREMTAALWACDGKVKYTEHLNVGHDAWKPAYGTPLYMDWFFAQRRRAPSR